MKLGEAKKRLEQIRSQIGYSVTELATCPLEMLESLLEQCNSLLAAESSLVKKIAQTEDESLLEGNVLSEVLSAFSVLKKKVSLLESLAVRQDLPAAKKRRLIEQLYSFRSTRDALELSIEQHNWETELLG